MKILLKTLTIFWTRVRNSKNKFSFLWGDKNLGLYRPVLNWPLSESHAFLCHLISQGGGTVCGRGCRIARARVQMKLGE
jgi:hypothetical protein